MDSTRWVEGILGMVVFRVVLLVGAKMCAGQWSIGISAYPGVLICVFHYDIAMMGFNFPPLPIFGRCAWVGIFLTRCSCRAKIVPGVFRHI